MPPMARASRGWLIVEVVVGAALVAGCGAWWALRHPRLPSDLSRGGLELALAVTADAPSEAATLDAPAVTERILALHVCTPTVSVAGRSVIVRVPPLSPADLERVKAALTVGGRLEFREIDEGRALRDLALPAGVQARAEQWSAPTGMAEGVVLDGELSALTALARTMQRPAELDPLIEPPAASSLPEGEPPVAHLYLVKRGGLAPHGLAEARVVMSTYSNRPEIQGVFSREDGQRFGELTARVVGRKLAIVVDGRIMSAPVVMTAIYGGRVNITLGSLSDAATALEETERLARALRAGALPWPVTLERESLIPPR